MHEPLTAARTPPLSTAERSRLQELERVIDAGLEQFLAVARALIEIRDLRLYREIHPTWQCFVEQRFGMARTTAYSLMAAAKVADNVSTSGQLSLSLLRELAPLEPATQRELAPVISEMTVAEARRTIRLWRSQNRRQQEEREPPPLPTGTFRTIHCDPPWTWTADYGDGLANDRYRCLSLDEIVALPVATLAAPDAHLYLWVPAAKIADGLRVIDAWGFTFRTQLVWVKSGGSLGLGTWFRMGTEPLLFATRGTLPTRGTDIPNWFKAPRGRHSEKPDEAYALIERASPAPYLDLFARRTRGGAWTAWGDEIPSDRGARIARSDAAAELATAARVHP